MGLSSSLLITTVLYILVTLVLTGMVPFKNLNVEDAVAFALRQVGAGWAGNYVSLVAILTLITVCISTDLCPLTDDLQFGAGWSPAKSYETT